MTNRFSRNAVKLCIGTAGIAELALGATTTTCNGLGPSDTCNLLCSGAAAGSGKSFYCGNAGDCRFECREEKCATDATIYGENAATLNINPTSGEQCLKGVTVYAPDSGDLYLNQRGGTKAYRDMSIRAGSNTQNIIVDCTGGQGDDCKEAHIYAQNAQYLEINVGSSSQFEGDEKNNEDVNVYCPQNSDYDGSEIAPCMIDVSNGGLLDRVNIYTQYGIPRDVWINKGSGTITNTVLFCDAGSTENFFSKSNTCWNTHSPTQEPTVSPTTKEPTLSPTNDPTLVPTSGPTINPSDSPTLNPSQTPSSQPTQTPNTRMPTDEPSVDPTIKPSQSPSLSPVISDHESTQASDKEGDDDQDQIITGSTQLSITTLIAIIVISLILCALCGCILIFIRKLRRSDAEIQKNVQMENQLDTSQVQRGRKKASDRILVKKFFQNDVQLPNYYELFVNNGYDSMKAIAAIRDRTELEEIGVSLYGHQSQILTEIRRLKETDGAQTGVETGAETGAEAGTFETNETFEFGGGYGEGPGANGVSGSGFETNVNIIAGGARYEPDNIDFGQDSQQMMYNNAQQNNYYGYNMNYGANMIQMQNMMQMQMAQQNMAQMYRMNMAQQQNMNNNNNYGQRAQQAVGFNDLPPPPKVDASHNTKGNKNAHGKNNLMNDMILQQKQRIMDLQRGEGGSRTSLTGVGTLESEDLFGAPSNEQRYIMPYDQDTKK